MQKSLGTAEFGICFKKPVMGVYHPLENDPPLTRGTNGSLDPIAHMVLEILPMIIGKHRTTNSWGGKVSQFFEQQKFWFSGGHKPHYNLTVLGLPGKGTQKFYKSG